MAWPGIQPSAAVVAGAATLAVSDWLGASSRLQTLLGLLAVFAAIVMLDHVGVRGRDLELRDGGTGAGVGSPVILRRLLLLLVLLVGGLALQATIGPIGAVLAVVGVIYAVYLGFVGWTRT